MVRMNRPIKMDMRTTYTVVTDETGRAVKAYGLGQNITADKKVQERYEHEMEYLRQNSDQRLIFKARCNLTKDVILDYTPLSEYAYPIQANAPYDRTWMGFTELVHAASDKRALHTTIDRGNLIQRYQQGELHHQIQYCRQSEGAAIIWVSLVIHTYMSPDAGDIECIMSEEFLTRLYEPFSQEHRPESANVIGTGLGLAIVKRIVDLMGGRIEVQSKIQVGTKFTIYLPLQRVDDADSYAPAQPLPEGSLAGKKVLLCEDNRLNTEIAVILLKEQGVCVDCAADGKDGVTAFRDSMKNPPAPAAAKPRSCSSSLLCSSFPFQDQNGALRYSAGGFCRRS